MIGVRESIADAHCERNAHAAGSASAQAAPSSGRT
jgi:hypothetical protein